MGRAAQRIATTRATADGATREDTLAGPSYLDDYRAAVERLRGETAAEVGGQPMPPEAFSMIAVMLTALPLMATYLPAIPVQPNGWQAAAALLVAWLVAFRIQSQRYARFDDRWRCKIAAHHAAESLVPAPSYLSRR